MGPDSQHCFLREGVKNVYLQTCLLYDQKYMKKWNLAEILQSAATNVIAETNMA